ncbi:MAG: DUF7146 domain-containing protein [Marinobacter sp.]|uniref:DUF7146 domain-containing protein n=1 Tax=Marinobacter sp. TaxID=50741 RepID=UPI003C652D74
MRQNTRDLAKGKWRGLLMQLGIDQSYLTGKHGPCPVCGGKDRFRFDDKLQAGNWICSQCGSGDGFELIMAVRDADFKTIAREVDQIVGSVEEEKPRPKRDPRRALRNIGKKLERLSSKDPVSLYLRNRGIGGIPSYALRLHPRLGYFDQGNCIGMHPAMVAKIENVDGQVESFHITYLTPEGEKAGVQSPKKVMSPVNGINGAAIRLAPVAEHIAVTEGIENALAVMEGEGLPCWACVSANGIETFKAPEGVKWVSIYCDNDASFTGQAAAYALAKRLHREGIKSDVFISGNVGDDYLDCLIRSRRVAA